MKVAIVGSRGIIDYDSWVSNLAGALSGLDISEIVSGGAKGVDSLAARYAHENEIPLVEFLPDYTRFGRRANMDKPANRIGKVQLIDASHCYEPRRKPIGTKRNDISDTCRNLIVKAYGQFENDAVYYADNNDSIYCESKIFDVDDFGYSKIVIEQPQRDEKGNIILKKGKPVANKELRDTEDVPLKENIDDFFQREVFPYSPDAWIDKSATKIGYEIPMTRYFYKYQIPEPTDSIQCRLFEIEKEITDSLNNLFGE